MSDLNILGMIAGEKPGYADSRVLYAQKLAVLIMVSDKDIGRTYGGELANLQGEASIDTEDTFRLEIATLLQEAVEWMKENDSSIPLEFDAKLEDKAYVLRAEFNTSFDYNDYYTKKNDLKLDIESIDSNNSTSDPKKLLLPNESIQDEIISKFNIDCLEINEELVKMSPFLKTILTPQEIYVKIVPKIFDCFDTYWKIKKKLAKLSTKYMLRNSQNIRELLDLKFNNDYDEAINDYKIHKYVSFILIDSLIDKYKHGYIDKSLNKKLKTRRFRRYFKNSAIKYARFKQDFRYDFITKLNPLAFLHNIYYEYLSKHR